MTHLSDPGRVRSGNEDSVLCVADPGGQRGHLAVVADGMGGAEAGEVASRMATEIVAEVYLSSPLAPREALAQAVADANARIHRAANERPDTRGMGTTCSALALVAQRAYVAHVGDSRVYCLRGADLARLTRVHSVWGERVARDGASPAIPSGRNVLTRALGIDAEVQVETADAIEALPGDRFLLCSDGLWGLVTDPEIAATAAAHEPEDACRRLVALANARGGPDNVSVVIAQVQA